MRIINKFCLGSADTNCYIIEVNDNIVLIDAPENIEVVINYLNENNLNIDYVLVTHVHYDHIAGLNILKETYSNLKVVVNSNEEELLYDSNLNLGTLFNKDYKYKYDVIDYSNIDFIDKIFKISGHSKESIAILFEDSNTLFSGDTLFKESIGRSDLLYGDYYNLIYGIINNFSKLDENTVVYPGHGDSTTIGYEFNNNMYIRKELNER